MEYVNKKIKQVSRTLLAVLINKAAQKLSIAINCLKAAFVGSGNNFRDSHQFPGQQHGPQVPCCCCLLIWQQFTIPVEKQWAVTCECSFLSSWHFSACRFELCELCSEKMPHLQISTDHLCHSTRNKTLHRHLAAWLGRAQRILTWLRCFSSAYALLSVYCISSAHQSQHQNLMRMTVTRLVKSMFIA